MDLSPSQLGPRFEIRSGFILAMIAPQKILERNTNRVTVSFNPMTGIHISVSNKSSVSTADFTFHLGVESPFILRFDDFGPLIGFEWFCNGDLDNAPMLFTEVIYRPDR